MTSNVFRSSPITDIATHDTDCHRHYRSAANFNPAYTWAERRSRAWQTMFFTPLRSWWRQ